MNEDERTKALWAAGVVSTLRGLGGYSEEEIAAKAKFESVEHMKWQLEKWDLPDWLVRDEPEVEKPRPSEPPASTRRMRATDPPKELPPAGNAEALFKEQIQSLLERAEHLAHMHESMQGKYFVRTDVDTTPVYFSRDFLPEELWETIRAQYNLDADAKDFLDTNTYNRFPGGVSMSPSELEATLIAVYALADGRMDQLLDALHLEPEHISSDTLEGIRLCIHGSKTDGDKRDGLKVLARHLATWVRGSEVRPGKPAGLSAMEHGLACRITQHRKDGLTDEEITRQLSRYKKEDGTSYGIDDVVKLGRLNLTWK